MGAQFIKTRIFNHLFARGQNQIKAGAMGDIQTHVIGPVELLAETGQFGMQRHPVEIDVRIIAKPVLGHRIDANTDTIPVLNEISVRQKVFPIRQSAINDHIKGQILRRIIGGGNKVLAMLYANQNGHAFMAHGPFTA